MSYGGGASSPVIWRALRWIAPDLASQYNSPFFRCPIERAFYPVWLHVMRSESAELRYRLRTWYVEDLHTRPGSHRPIEHRLGVLTECVKLEHEAFLSELSARHRIWTGAIVLFLPMAKRYLNNRRDYYRFYGSSDAVWIGPNYVGRGGDHDF